ncbi:NAD-dependent epimerase/dehydratase family protein [Propionibacteriaceae bacterium Y2011]|uniref:NAD-dependent epimerase/dehydratase family protein n=1 Tax=Microlunatus sp. Y2014 TaxID=3418488 RepID=UPI003B49AB71
MRVLLVDIPDILFGPLRESLGRAHDVDALTADLLDTELPHAEGYDLVVHGLGQGSDEDDQILRSTLGTWNLLQSMRAGRYLQLSSMRILAGYDDGWAVRESWLPRPELDGTSLAVHLGEITGRELSRNRAVATLALRLDEVVDADRFAAEDVDPRWLHVDDAVSAIVTAATVPLPQSLPAGSWKPLHIVRGDGRYELVAAAASPFGWAPKHLHPQQSSVPVPQWPATPQPVTDLPPSNRITVYGAGGPMGAATAVEFTEREFVRLTDLKSMAELATRAPQSPGAPLPSPPSAPHEDVPVDITDLAQVRAAAAGADCLVNLSVMRNDVGLAFRVNLLGARNVMLAAVDEGIRRVVHTGPTLAIAPFPIGSDHDRRVDGTQNFRAGDWVYLMTKLLGQEVVRLFAERHQIAAPVLLYNGFSANNPDTETRRGGQKVAFVVSWADSARSVAAAADVTRLPEPSPVVNVLAPSPHDHYTVDRARDVLGWEASDRLDRAWYAAGVSLD